MTLKVGIIENQIKHGPLHDSTSCTFMKSVLVFPFIFGIQDRNTEGWNSARLLNRIPTLGFSMRLGAFPMWWLGSKLVFIETPQEQKIQDVRYNLFPFNHLVLDII